MKYFLMCLLGIVLGCQNNRNTLPDPSDLEAIELSPKFESFLIKRSIDKNPVPDGQILRGEIKDLDSLDIILDGNGNSLKGLESFSGLKYLKYRGIQRPTNISNQYFYAFMGGIVEEYIPSVLILDVSNNLNLEYLDCSGGSDGGGYWSSVGSIKFGNNSKLKVVKSTLSMFKSLDLASLTSLEDLYVDECMIMKDLSLCTNENLKKIQLSRVKRLYISSMVKPDMNWKTGNAQVELCK